MKCRIVWGLYETGSEEVGGLDRYQVKSKGREKLLVCKRKVIREIWWVQNVDGKKIILINIIMGYTFPSHFVYDCACETKLGNLVYFIISW